MRRDLLPPSPTPPPSSVPGRAVDLLGVACFAAYDEFGTELWRADGTAAGTVRRMARSTLLPAKPRPDAIAEVIPKRERHC
ncbi:MAG: hypothetical protein FJ265_19780 [Planctomycetes bacterium]|nr:hypothetical protein [Planctomycetota bacterium]